MLGSEDYLSALCFLFLSALLPSSLLFFFLPGVIFVPLEAASSLRTDAGIATDILLGIVFCFFTPVGGVDERIT